MARASNPWFRCFAERCDRRSLREISAPCPTEAELLSYRRRRILDRESQVLVQPSLETAPVLSSQSAPDYGRQWERHDRFQPLQHTVVRELRNARLREARSNLDQQSKSLDPRKSP